MSIDRAFADASRFRVCFVCTGNICRSPMAAAAFDRLAERGGLADRVLVTSAGISEYHVGETADPRTIAALTAAGYDASHHRAKRFESGWFADLDLVIALDRGQERVLTSMTRDEEHRSKVRLLMSFDPDAETMDVPDPYYSDEAFFGTVLQQIETAVARLFRQLQPAFH